MESLIFSLASATGWTEEYILNLPLARVLSYKHCEMFGHPFLWTVSPEARAEAAGQLISPDRLEAILREEDGVEL